ncbi:MAG: caspase family protein [Elusimicrobia bacterium]|nr:caspase family protein [Elusimicrobiota bacterium]
MLKRALLGLLALCPALSGCTTLYLVDRGQRTPMKLEGFAGSGVGPAEPLDLQAGIVPDPPGAGGELYRIGERKVSAIFARVGAADSPTCDVRVTVQAAGKWRWTFSSGRTDQRLFAVEADAGATNFFSPPLETAMAKAAYDRLAAFHAQLLAERSLPRRPQAAAAAPPAAAAEADVPAYREAERPHDLAVVVGVEDYSDLPRAAYAENDARAFAAHARALGVPARNLVLLTGPKAVKSALEKYVDEWLPRMARPESRVFFYFSGHGAPDVRTGQAFLVPYDGDPNFLASTAYPVKRLYQKLAALPARQVLAALDACFSGAGGRSVLASGARPLVTKVDAGAVSGRVTALTASAANEISGALDERRRGAFTYFLLRGLDGEAGDFSAAGLMRYATPLVQEEARRLNRDQTPQLLGDGTARFR